MTLTPDKTAELKAKYGDLQAVETPMGTLVFKRASRMVFDRWSDGLTVAGKSRSELNRQLAQDCLVFPEWAEFVTVIDRYPGILAGEVIEACTADTGNREKYEVKKL